MKITVEFTAAVAKVDALLALEILGKRSNVDTASRKEKPAYIQELIDDAISKGAQVINEKGGEIVQTIFFQRFCTNK
jgi:glyceraldehyde-3-phosphate dehydrogenase (NADP+)